MSSDAHTPAQRADAVLRAAEAAAAAARAAAAPAQAASPPESVEPRVRRRGHRARAAARARPRPRAGGRTRARPAGEPPIHEAGAAGRLLAAAGELEGHVAQARAQLDALEDALARLERYDPPAE